MSRADEFEVSVVIPTIGRSSLRRAVESALNQSTPPLEVVVVLDRDCEPDLPDSPAVRVVRTSGGLGPSLAKHAGIQAALGNVIALLDDDDAWRPAKLATQLAAAPPGDEWILSSRFARHAAGEPEVVGPRTLIDPQERIGAYLYEFRERQAFNMVCTPTLVFPRHVVDAVPFSVAGGSIHDDPTWLMEVRRRFPDIPIIQLPEPLVDIDWTAMSVSRSGVDRSRDYIDWGVRQLAAETARVRGDYMLTYGVGSALGAGSFTGLARSIAAGVRHGRPGRLAWASAAKSTLKLTRQRLRSGANRDG